MAEVIGSIEVVATINTKDYDAAKKRIEKGNDELEGNASKASKGFSAAWAGAMAGAMAVVVNKGINLLTSSVDSAVKRVDSLVAFPRVLKALGASAEDAANATAKMSDRLQGLPTGLDEAAEGVQSLVVAGLDVGKATDAYLAFNDAVLAGSVDSVRASAGMDMLNKAINTGKITADQWTSISTAMPTAMKALQNESGKSSDELRKLYSTDPQKLIDDIIRLDKKGGGGLQSLEEQARAATGGIQTAMDNLRNAISRGYEAIVRSIGDGGTDAEKLESGQRKISEAISSVGKAMGDTLKTIARFVEWIQQAGAAQDVIKALAVSVGTVVAIFTVWTTAIKVWTTATSIARGVMIAFNAAMRANPIGLVITAITALVAAVVWFFTKTETGKAIFQNVMNFIRGLINNLAIVFQNVWNVIKGVWSGVASFFRTIFSAIATALTIYIQIYIQAFKLAWTAIKAIWGVVSGWFKSVWEKIKSVFSTVGSWFKGVFQSAWNAIKNIFGNLYGFFKGIWNKVIGLFRNVGTRVGDAIGGAFKNIINKIVGSAIGIINGFIDKINGVVGIINKIPKVNVPKIGRLPVPQLATGGIVSSATLALIGEGSEPEAVIPLSKLDSMLNGDGGGGREYNIGTINIASEVDGDRWLRRLTDNQEITSSRLVPNQNYM